MINRALKNLRNHFEGLNCSEIMSIDAHIHQQKVDIEHSVQYQNIAGGLPEKFFATSMSALKPRK